MTPLFFLSFDLLFTRHALSGENIHTNKQNQQQLNKQIPTKIQKRITVRKLRTSRDSLKDHAAEGTDLNLKFNSLPIYLLE